MTTHKNQVGQAGTGVNGGEFAKKNQTTDDVTLTAPMTVRAANKELHAAEAALEAAETRYTAAYVEMVAAKLRDWFPTGKTAHFGHPGYDLTVVALSEITDENGNAVYRYARRDADAVVPPGLKATVVDSIVSGNFGVAGDVRKFLDKVEGADRDGVTYTLTLR